MTMLSTHAQRTHSLLTGEARTEPIHPIRRSPGAVRIGNRRIIVEMPRYWTAEELNKPQPHTCAAMEMGEVCPHI